MTCSQPLVERSRSRVENTFYLGARVEEMQARCTTTRVIEGRAERRIEIDELAPHLRADI